MRIAIMGAGALGCYFGGRLALAGNDVHFIARGAHLDAMKTNGLQVKSPLGDFTIEKPQVHGDPATVGPVDYVLFLVKLFDTEAAAHQIGPLLGEETAVISFQNGIDPWERIGAIIGMERVIGGAALIPAEIVEPGVIHHNAGFAKLVFGEFHHEFTERVTRFKDVLDAARVSAEATDAIDVQLWEKFIMLSAFSATTSLMRSSIGPVMANPLARSFFQNALQESFTVGKAECPAIKDDYVAQCMAFMDKAAPSMRSSMSGDLERGKRLEVNDLSGAVVRIAEKHGIDTPTHRVTVQALSLYADGSPS
ncbi:MAG: ketopantoate reductase family protein [Pseudomonadota bacterium]